MKKEADTIIIGGTYFGIGYACAHPGCLILESSQVLGGDFHKGLRTADASGLGAGEADTEPGRLMRKYGVWKDGRFDVLKAAPVLHEYVAGNKDIRLLVNVKILSVKPVDDGYQVEYVSNSGIHRIYCSKLLDTSALRETWPEGARCISKTLNLFTLSVNEAFDERIRQSCPEWVVEAGTREGERFVKIPCSKEATLAEAYEVMTARWNEAFPNGEEKILFVAEEFDYICEGIHEELAPCPWNGERFSNPLTAFVKGMEAEET